ncbi:hypothetical protein [Halalkalicoccus ordinarius]|uniref:hypothetical protein n=1 Tax=Halalkalicoccus ordinarius TaxID=3116651 RepID=UPI00300F5634
MPERHTMKDVDHCPPFADELTSVWHRGGEGRIEESDDGAEAAESDGRFDTRRMPADD